MPPGIHVESVSKRYRVAHDGGAVATSLSEQLVQAVGATLSKFHRRGASIVQDYWAVRDISFQVNAGDVLGILGRNGAGKSTLLKIISRVVSPTCGRVRVRGRVGSLLEVGSGFHPELTGRENIMLNGTILGMSRREIRTKFDAIVAFSGIEDFLDTPVKRYSSGMYMRLAFAVAVHVDPEVLNIDVVLGVGDAAYQARCTERLRGLVRDEGKAVLVVSHNVDTLRSLCNRALFLHAGHLVLDGTPEEVIRLYGNMEDIHVTDDGRVTMPELEWVTTALVIPELLGTREDFRVERCYRVSRAAVSADFMLRYYASPYPALGTGDEILIGEEKVKDPAHKSTGTHFGSSGTLRIGRPGPQYVLAVIDSPLAKRGGASGHSVIRSPGPVAVDGLCELVVDNGQLGYTELGSHWYPTPGGVGGDCRYCEPPGNGTQTATWTFSGLPPGRFVVYATWVPYAARRATNATYRICDGDRLLHTCQVSQRVGPQGIPWREWTFQKLGTVTIVGGTLRVVLGNDADDYVIADAVMIEQIHAA